MDFENVKCKIIGITGGIGAGKSMVSAVLKDDGAQVIDCDILAKDLVAKGMPAHAEIINHFGKDILDEDGEINRKLLGRMAFSNPEEIRLLNRITHGYVYAELDKQIADFKMRFSNNPQSVLFIEAPVPDLKHFKGITNEIWAVIADEESRIERVVNRDGLQANDVIKRMQNQNTNEEYANAADKIIDNLGDYEELKAKVLEMLRRVRNGE